MDAIQNIAAGDSGNLVLILSVGGGLLVAIVAIIAGTLQKVAQSKAREESRREIAAYIAEGSISAAEGERLMAAGGRGCKKV